MNVVGGFMTNRVVCSDMVTDHNDRGMSGEQQPKEQNGSWSARDTYWGNGFVARVKTTGNEAKGEIPHVKACQALMNYLKSDESSFTPEGKPDSPDEIDVGNTQIWEWYLDDTYLTFTLAGERELVDDEFGGVRNAIDRALDDEWEVA